MRQNTRISTRLMGLGAAAIIAATAGTAAGETSWDDEKVASLVHDVVVETSRIKKNLAREWDRADKASARYIVLNDLMTLQHRAVALEGLIRGGEGRDKTEPVYRRVRSAVLHAREDAQKFPAVEEQRKHIDAANAALTSLAEYYGGE